LLSASPRFDDWSASSLLTAGDASLPALLGGGFLSGSNAEAAGQTTTAAAATALRVLVVEDDSNLLEILLHHLERLGYSVRGTTISTRALQLLEHEPADVVLSDIRMPGMDGLTLMRGVLDRFPTTKVVLMTAFGSSDDAEKVVKEGAFTCLTKPFKVDEVAAVLRSAARDTAGG
jgi:two-component system response regulator AtoC